MRLVVSELCRPGRVASQTWLGGLIFKVEFLCKPNPFGYFLA